MEIVERRVKPVRLKDSQERRRRLWWLFGAEAKSLYNSIANKNYILATAYTTPHLMFSIIRTGFVYANTIVVSTVPERSGLAVLQSRLHEIWARFFSSSMKDDLRYAPSDCFETFPFPPNYEVDPVLEGGIRVCRLRRRPGSTQTRIFALRPRAKSALLVTKNAAVPGETQGEHPWTRKSSQVWRSGSGLTQPSSTHSWLIRRVRFLVAVYSTMTPAIDLRWPSGRRTSAQSKA